MIKAVKTNIRLVFFQLSCDDFGMSLPRFTHWIFDLDGTIIDSSKHYEIAVKTILQENSIEPTAEFIDRAYKYFNPEEYFATFFKDAAQIRQCRKRLDQISASQANDIEAFDGMKEILQDLQDRQIPVSVWTGRETESAKTLLGNNGLSQFISLCVGRTCVPKNKPHPDGLLKILKDLNLQTPGVVMVGDHEYDMLGAKSAKVAGISVNWEGKAHGAASLISDHHFQQIPDFHSWIKKSYENSI